MNTQAESEAGKESTPLNYPGSSRPSQTLMRPYFLLDDSSRTIPQNFINNQQAQHQVEEEQKEEESEDKQPDQDMSTFWLLFCCFPLIK